MGFAATYLELDPGEAFSGRLHVHADREELFVVLERTATWETREGPGEASTLTEVGPMETVHFGAGDVYQSGSNESDGVVRGIAIGVPGSRHDRDGTRALVDCETCGEGTVFRLEGEGRMPDIGDVTITWRECGTDLEVRRYGTATPASPVGNPTWRRSHRGSTAPSVPRLRPGYHR